MTQAIAVSIVVVTFNSAHVVREMMTSLPRNDNVELLVVDNASIDKTVELVRAHTPHVRLIQNSSNLGFANAVNLGVSASNGTMILLLNPDARIDADDLRTCVQMMHARPTVGVLAPLVAHPAGRLETLEAGREPSLWRVFTHWSGASRCSRYIPFFEGFFLRPVDLKAARTVGWVSGSCMLIRRSAWDSVGGMTERYFMYAEDIDLCLRVKDAGYQVVLTTEATATHEIGGSSAGPAGESSFVEFAWFTNSFDLYRHRYGPGLLRLWLWRTIFAAGLLTRGLAYSWRDRRSSRGGVDWGREAKKFYRGARVMNSQPLRERNKPDGVAPR